MSMTFEPLSEAESKSNTFVILALRSKGKWLLSQDSDTGKWAFPQFSSTDCQSALQLAEAFAKTLDPKVSVCPVCAVMDDGICGLLCAAELSAGEVPKHMCFFELLPEEEERQDSRKMIRIYEQVQWWLNTRTGADELWDLYDENRIPTGEKHRRGDPMPMGAYHLVVQVWLQDPDGKILITQRAPNKGYAYFWECPGGAVTSGEDSLTAALREMREETGIELDPKNGSCILQLTSGKHNPTSRNNWFTDVWLFRQPFDPEKVICQPGETCNAKKASLDEIEQIDREGDFVPFSYLKKFIDMMRTKKGL